MPWLILACGVAFACVGWGWLEARWFAVRRVTVPVLPPGEEPLRVLHLADFHLTPRQGRKIRWIRGLGSLRPDLVIMTGDNLGGEGSIPVLLDALQPLSGVPGVFVYGSHDYWAPHAQNPFAYFKGPTKAKSGARPVPTGDLTRGLKDLGWADLNNARTALSVEGTRVSFVGVDDPHVRRDRMPDPDASRGVAHLGVVHAPYGRVLEAFRGEGVDLVLAGHTHGGQVRIPVVGALVTNCDLDRRRARGLSGWPGPRPDARGGEGSIWLHVSAGAGTSPFAPVRFACRPEATVLELVPRREG